MVENRKYLTGISSNDYIHPTEKKIRINSSENISKGLDALNDLSVSLVRRITLGKHIHVTDETAPVLYNIVKDVCEVLDYAPVPQVYICHQAAQTMFCAGTDQNQITLSDYILEQYDYDMLYFAIGNLISMFKSGHVKLVTVCSMMPPTPVGKAFELLLNTYLRAADLSSDRGGLLACQSFPAAARCILWDAGIPISDTQKMNEDEIIKISEAYINATDTYSPGWLEHIAMGWENLNMTSTPYAYRLKELLTWYRSGYTELLQHWK